jgi:hypothetical protein
MTFQEISDEQMAKLCEVLECSGSEVRGKLTGFLKVNQELTDEQIDKINLNRAESRNPKEDARLFARAIGSALIGVKND